jgi:uncharacterized protein (TIGR02001 family)
MKLSQGLAAIVLAMSAAAVHADVTGTVTATTDYDFRGFTQTAQKPALQGSLDYTHASGFYAGAWGSNIDFGNHSSDCCRDANVELDIYAGWRGGTTIAYDLGAIYYSYPGAETQYGGHTINYPEIYAGATYKWLTGKIFYSWDFGATKQSAEYYSLDAAVPLPASFGFTAHTGFSDGNYWGSNNYFDWSAGFTYAMGNFALSLKWVDGSDFKPGNDVPHDVFSTDPRAIFSISTTFPWKTP